MTRVTYELSHFPTARVIGTGTTLDTARLRYLLGDYFDVDPKNIHAYVIGEHGDSEFVPWSQAMLATKPIKEIFENKNNDYCFKDTKRIEEKVRRAAYKIIQAKQATYYGIGMALARITKAILSDEKSVLTISTKVTGVYGSDNVFVGIPSIVGRKGIEKVIELSLSSTEIKDLKKSSTILQTSFEQLKL